MRKVDLRTNSKETPDMDSRDDVAFCARVDEETPLTLGSLVAPRRTRRSFWRDLLFNPKETPGVENENTLVRLLTLVWHVAKVALLSCKKPLFREMLKPIPLITGIILQRG